MLDYLHVVYVCIPAVASFIILKIIHSFIKIKHRDDVEGKVKASARFDILKHTIIPITYIATIAMILWL